MDYKIVALESTGTVFQQMRVDKFREIFDIVGDVLPKPEKEEQENGESSNKENEEDEDEERSSKKLDLLHSVLITMGLCWPSSQETARWGSMFGNEKGSKLRFCAENSRKNIKVFVNFHITSF